MSEIRNEKEFIIKNDAMNEEHTDNLVERVNNCVAEIQNILNKYDCVIDHYYIIHGTEIIPQLKVVPKITSSPVKDNISD